MPRSCVAETAAEGSKKHRDPLLLPVAATTDFQKLTIEAHARSTPVSNTVPSTRGLTLLMGITDGAVCPPAWSPVNPLVAS